MELKQFEFQMMLKEIDRVLASEKPKDLKGLLETELTSKKQHRLVLSMLIAKYNTDDNAIGETDFKKVEILMEELGEELNIRKFATRANKYNQFEKPDIELMRRLFCFNVCPVCHTIDQTRGYIGGLSNEHFRALLKILPELPAWDDRLNSEVILQTLKYGIFPETNKALREVYFAM